MSNGHKRGKEVKHRRRSHGFCCGGGQRQSMDAYSHESFDILGLTRPFTGLILLCSLYIMLDGSDNPETIPHQKTA